MGDGLGEADGLGGWDWATAYPECATGARVRMGDGVGTGSVAVGEGRAPCPLVVLTSWPSRMTAARLKATIMTITSTLRAGISTCDAGRPETRMSSRRTSSPSSTSDQAMPTTSTLSAFIADRLPSPVGGGQR